MATIGTSYEDYKASHPLTQYLEANDDGYRPTYWATLDIAEAIGAENDFFDPQKLSALSEEALTEMAADLGEIARHFDNITYYTINGDSSTSDGIVDLYLGPNDVEGAKKLIDEVPLEHGSLVIGILNRDFVRDGLAPDVVQDNIIGAIEGFKKAYQQGIEAAWEAKAEMNGLVEHLVDDLSVASVALHQDTLKDLSPEQQEYFKEQVNGYAAYKRVDTTGINEALDQAFAGELDLDDVLEREHAGGAPLVGDDHVHDGANIELLAHHIIEHNAEAHAAEGNNLKNHKADILNLTAEEQVSLRSEIEAQGGEQVDGGYFTQDVLDDLLGDYDEITAEGHAEADHDHDIRLEAPAPAVVPGVEL